MWTPAVLGQETCFVQRIGTPTNAQWFGVSLAVDGQWAIIGAHRADGPVVNSGLAYMFRRASSGLWLLHQTIAAPDAETGDSFGIRADIEGNLLVIGAVGDDDVADNAGAIYVYIKDEISNAWRMQQKVVSPAAIASAQFGTAVAVSGTSVAVSASREASNSPTTGTAYIVEPDASGVWAAAHTFTSPFGEPNDGFAASLDLDGDWLIVGAPYAGGDIISGDDWVGAVCLYQRSAFRWRFHSILQPPKTDRGFGSSVNASGSRLAIGTLSATPPGSNWSLATSFQVRDVLTNVWVETNRYVAPMGAFGIPTGRWTDLHQDTFVTGGNWPWHDNFGVARVLQPNPEEQWLTISTVFPPDGKLHYHGTWGFGRRVATDGETMLVGDLGDAPGGIVYVYESAGHDCNVNGVCDWADIANGTSGDQRQWNSRRM
jgi:hypothetical protein